MEPLVLRLLPGRLAAAGVLALCVLLVTPPAQAASANEVRTDSPDLLIPVGSSATVGYRIDPGTEGCNASPSTPVDLTFLIPESFGVFPDRLTFTACGVWKHVTYTASAIGRFTIGVRTSDGSGILYQTGYAASSVLVHAPGDVVPPIITMPPDVWAEATSPAGAEVFYVVSATDASDQVDHITCEPGSTLFPVGRTLVTCTAVDGRGNTDVGVFNVTIVDTTPPRLVVPRDVTLLSPTPPVLTYSPLLARDIVDGDFLPTCDPPSGSAFYSGATLVTCTATDRAGNSATRTFTVTVLDDAPPELLLADVSVPAEGPEGAHVPYVATASDALDPDPLVECAPPSGSLFPLGPTLVTCTATDGSGNVATGAFTVRVLDQAPVVLVPTLPPFEAAGPGGAPVSFTATASDPEDGDLVPACLPASGSTFPLGVTLVTCTATDSSGNVASASFEVRVVDTTPPDLSLPAALAVDATGPLTLVTFPASALDLVSGSVAPVCAPASGSALPPGGTLVTCVATDAAGNAATASFTVTVVDRTPPVITAPALLRVDGAAPTVVTYPSSALDDVDGIVAVTCSPPSGSTFPLGDTSVACVATDASGNAATHVFVVTVAEPAPAPSGECGSTDGGLDDRHDGKHTKDRHGLGLGHDGRGCCDADPHRHSSSRDHALGIGHVTSNGLGHCGCHHGLGHGHDGEDGCHTPGHGSVGAKVPEGAPGASSPASSPPASPPRAGAAAKLR